MNRRYEPVDGGISLALSFGLFVYQFFVHLKNLELQDALADERVPSASQMRSAWAAFLSKLAFVGDPHRRGTRSDGGQGGDGSTLPAPPDRC